jgi:hypothetical protein
MRFLLGLILVPAILGCNVVVNNAMNNAGTLGDGISKTETRTVDAIEKIEIGNAIELEVIPGEKPTLELTTDSNLLSLIKTEIVGKTLKISSEGSWSSKIGVKVKLTAKNIAEVTSSSSSKATLAKDTIAEKVTLDASSASAIHIAGSAKVATLKASSASTIHAFELTVEEATADASSASSIELNATKKLKANASSAANVVYTTKPEKLEVSSSSAGSVSQK